MSIPPEFLGRFAPKTPAGYPQENVPASRSVEPLVGPPGAHRARVEQQRDALQEALRRMGERQRRLSGP
jgi:hypothetical protein